MILQRTSEWYAARLGKFTASKFSYLMAKPANKSSKWSKSALNYIEKKATELYYKKHHERPDNDATRWGHRNESAALLKFSENTGYQTIEAGFVLHKNLLDVGATPDAYVFENGNNENPKTIQVKCPYNPKIHADYFNRMHSCWDLKRIKSGYYLQMQGEIWVTEAEYSFFASFDPRATEECCMRYFKVLRDDKTIDMLENRLKESIELRNEILNDLRNGARSPRSLQSFW